MKRLILFLAAAGLVSGHADQGVTVVPKDNVNLDDVNFTGQATNAGGFTINLLVSCFGTNLRNVPNPLQPNSNITAIADFVDHGGKSGQVMFSFPSSTAIMNKSGITGTTAYTDLTPGKSFSTTPAGFATIDGAIQGQTIVVTLSGTKAPIGEKAYDFKGIEFKQTVPGPDPSYSYDESVARSLSFNYSADKTMLFIEASFPGSVAAGCGSYYSPLMLFTGDQRPKFENVADFKLREGPGRYHWPEGSSDWAFIAIDKNGNGKIDDGEELFGAGRKFKNGFEALRAYDSNKDGKIDKKDKDYAKLKLWYDLNGNGVTDPGELFSLESKSITEISLKYDSSIMTPLGRLAQLRERSKAKMGKKKVDVVDVWLGDVPAAVLAKGK